MSSDEDNELVATVQRNKEMQKEFLRKYNTQLLTKFVNDAINFDKILRYDGLYKFIDEFVEENINDWERVSNSFYELVKLK